jgi:cyclic pyranopterin phosphate synthase
LLRDTFGRVADDLRISVTDRCNLRCVYCMPADGMRWLPRAEILTFEEIERLARVFVSLGVRTIRLTGGEPLVRQDLPELIGRLARLDPRPELSLTTNGILLAQHAAALKAAGLDRVNVSLDSLRDERNLAITRRPALDRTLAGLAAARAAGLTPVKINCVVMRGVNDDELAEFAALARTKGYVVRFIEFMPLDAEGRWREHDVVSAREMLDSLAAAGEAVEKVDSAGPDPASRYRLRQGEIGIIASVSEPFCASCNRIRLTAEGALRNCLFALDETDLRAPLRSGATDAQIEVLIRETVWRKWAGHHIGRPDFVRPAKSMSQIGG